MFEGWGAAIAATAVVGAATSAISSSNAASAQKDAANTAANTQAGMFNQIQANEQPYLQQGQAAESALSQFYGLPGANGAAQKPDYNKILSSLPGYQFQQQQGTQAVDRNLAAQGLLQSGAAGKELQQYGQGLAQNYAGQYTQGLQNLAQMGQASAGQQAVAGMNAANNISSSQIYAGNASAQGSINTGNAINGAINNGIGGYGLYSSYQNSLYGPNGAYAGGMNMGSAGNMAGYNSQLNTWADQNTPTMGGLN